MPNHVTNNLEFNCSTERSLEILEYLRVDGEVLGSIDFNKLIPMPKSLNIEAGSRGTRGRQLYEAYLKEIEGVTSVSRRDEIYRKTVSMCKDDPQMLELGKQYYENERDYGASNWYDWSIEHWGTKWNAYDWQEARPEDGFISFNTAWSPVPELIQILSSRFPDVGFCYSWADEDIGYNVGIIEFKEGSIVCEDIPEGGTFRAYEIACEIQGYDLGEFIDEIPGSGESAKKPEGKSQEAR